MAPLDRLQTSFYWRSIVTMTLSSVISEIKRDIGQKSRFFTPNLYSTPVRGGRNNIAIRFGKEKLEWRGDPMVTKSLRICLLFSTQNANVTDNRQTYRHIPQDGIGSAYAVTAMQN